jgi:hypothetical protein
MARERLDRHTMRLLQTIGLPEISEEQIESLAARLREAYAAERAAELQELQIGSDRSRNVGGETWPDVVEDGGPIMLDTIP